MLWVIRFSKKWFTFSQFILNTVNVFNFDSVPKNPNNLQNLYPALRYRAQAFCIETIFHPIQKINERMWKFHISWDTFRFEFHSTMYPVGLIPYFYAVRKKRRNKKLEGLSFDILPPTGAYICILSSGLDECLNKSRIFMSFRLFYWTYDLWERSVSEIRKNAISPEFAGIYPGLRVRYEENFNPTLCQKYVFIFSRKKDIGSFGHNIHSGIIISLRVFEFKDLELIIIIIIYNPSQIQKFMEQNNFSQKYSKVYVKKLT